MSTEKSGFAWMSPGEVQGLLLRCIPFHNLEAVGDEPLDCLPVPIDNDAP